MMLALFVAMLMAGPFWETKPPAEWTDQELEWMFRESPWAQAAQAAGAPEGARVYLATAQPMREAEKERLRRNPKLQALESGDDEEYRQFLREREGKVIVLAVMVPRIDPDAEKELQEGCTLKVGGRKIPIIGHFPPTLADPALRLVFPVTPAEGSLTFELYLPGVPHAWQQAEFRVKDLRYRGKPQM